jgi:hypothetical protein
MGIIIIRVVLTCTIFLSWYRLSAQNVTGIWRGYFITETGDEYRLEFQVDQNKSLSVSGVSYSYLDKRFYGKATMSGNFDVKNKSFQIQELRTTEVRNLGGGGTCLMNYKFSYAKSGKEEFLEGSYVGKSEDRLNPKNNGVWGDCGGGRVFLRRVEESDFYVEPFLREKPVVKKKTPSDKPIAKTTTPLNKSTTKSTAPVKKATAPPKTNAAAKKTTTTANKEVPQKSKTNEIKKTDTVIVRTVPKKITHKTFSLPAQTRSRENELVKTFTVRNDEIIVKLYDNGEIDGDTISVYLDNKIILSGKRLTASPLVITIKMEEDKPEHVLVMVADNLGTIPPNTSLMIVHDGDKRYEVRITSTEQKNAMVRFRYQPAS